ncbi:MAG TPA: ABC transporter ATP-binding protein [Candidatus Thiothrix moscowensis]|uniref:ABC transporter ATP-binding protein n=1 Tax=unclassified Thiothrix TaxID=2636184 RepID=UPI0025D45C80|nr:MULTISPECIES: ABC transporter ATP-binding protein [unclassified Thiothrix]HRJ54156.1 ABC transporter ATP-binding protein [Candidatus Thiothrix moscowensis]HRJ94352.1 ABC transporter ATP-binding protein [Candidatus Thiothrix moscowensis]
MCVTIKVENLSKKYVISHAKIEQYRTIRDIIPQKIAQWKKRLNNTFAEEQAYEEFFALSDIEFKIKTGERVGIIGHNGAGKSTLLKILSRITEPTSGKIQIHGRISSLLEVGTGFNQELTGRENIFLNGAILGMSKRDINQKFDEIVSFAEIEKFLDTPVKRYSSGMYMRLAFSVAAHLNSDILIIDEVLAVGDIQFQNKCLGKMESLNQSGRTVLFVTHNMNAMTSLCNRGIVLNKGRMFFDGSVHDARNIYLDISKERIFSIENNSGRGGSGDAKITNIEAIIQENNQINITIKIHIEKKLQHRTDMQIAFGIDAEDGTRVATLLSSWVDFKPKVINEEINAHCTINNPALTPGRYLISASIIFQGETLDSVKHCATFSILSNTTSFHIERLPDWGYMDLNFEFNNTQPLLHGKSNEN